jgi:hypothetical protein
LQEAFSSLHGRRVSEASNGYLSPCKKYSIGRETGHLIPASELTLRALGLDRNDPWTLMIAKKVLEIGEIGLKDKPKYQSAQ